MGDMGAVSHNNSNHADQIPVVAVILAAGFGTRFDPLRPKQLISIQGLPVVAWSIRAFERNARITDIVVVTNARVRKQVEESIDHYHFTKVRLVIDGGNERYESSYKALKALRSFGLADNARVLIHDAVRPFVSQRIIDDSVTMLDTYDAATVAVPSTDTIVISTVESSNASVFAYDHQPVMPVRMAHPPIVDSVPVRSRTFRAQTPQSFTFGVIEKAYDYAMHDSEFSPTDDTKVVIEYMPDTQVAIVQGEHSNMKLTTLDDLPVAEAIAQRIVQ